MCEDESYIVEEVKEEIMVPGGRLYELTARYVPLPDEIGDPLFDGRYERFIIYHDDALLKEILDLCKHEPFWKPFKFRSPKYFQNSGHFYINGKGKPCYKAPFLGMSYKEIFRHFEDEYDKDKVFLKKVFNAIVLNEGSMFVDGYNPPYYVYVFVPRFHHFIIKRSDEALKDECIFSGYVNLNDYRQLIQSKYGSSYVDYLNNELGMYSNHEGVDWWRLNQIGQEYFYKLHRYDYDDIVNVKLDIAITQLRKFNLDPTSSYLGQVFY